MECRLAAERSQPGRWKISPKREQANRSKRGGLLEARSRQVGESRRGALMSQPAFRLDLIQRSWFAAPVQWRVSPFVLFRAGRKERQPRRRFRLPLQLVWARSATPPTPRQPKPRRRLVPVAAAFPASSSVPQRKGVGAFRNPGAGILRACLRAEETGRAGASRRPCYFARFFRSNSFCETAWLTAWY